MKNIGDQDGSIEQQQDDFIERDQENEIVFLQFFHAPGINNILRNQAQQKDTQNGVDRPVKCEQQDEPQIRQQQTQRIKSK